MKRWCTFFVVLLECLFHGTLLNANAATSSTLQQSGSTQTPPEGKRMLGGIYDRQGRVRYYVVAEFYRVQAAIMMHGHSRVLFLNPQRVVVAQYEFGMPEELPYKLVQNTLFFGKGLPKGRQHQQRIDAVLPRFLCVGPEGCYAKE
jgi:hypothetical protein